MSDNLSIVLGLLVVGLIVLFTATGCQNYMKTSSANEKAKMQSCVEAGKDWQYIANTGHYQCVGGR
jgi:hypothetical protein